MRTTRTPNSNILTMSLISNLLREKNISVILVALLFCISTQVFSASKEPVDKMGVACVKVSKTTSEPMTDIFKGQGTRHNYEIKNNCDVTYEVIIKTLAGWSTSTSISPYKTRVWFCTDGTKINKNCGGGIESYSVK